MLKFRCTYITEHGRKQDGYLPVFTCASLPQESLGWLSNENSGVEKTRYMKRNKTKLRIAA